MPAFASRTLLFPLGTRLSLTVGLLPLSTVPIGVSMFRMMEIRSGWMPMLCRGAVSAAGPDTPCFAIAQQCRISHDFSTFLHHDTSL